MGSHSLELEIYLKFIILELRRISTRPYEVDILGAVKLSSALDMVPTPSRYLKVLFILYYTN